MKLAVKGVAETLGLRASFLAKTVSGRGGLERPRPPVLLAGRRERVRAPTSRRPSPRRPAPPRSPGCWSTLPAASLLLNPTINSYKRLVPGWFAPVNASWGYREPVAARSGRSPRPSRSGAGSSAGGREPTPTRTSRSPRCSCRRRTASAARRAPRAGRRRRLRARRPARRYRALSRAHSPPSARTRSCAPALGERFSDYYATSREWELSAWRDAVSDWERHATSGRSSRDLSQENSGRRAA